MHTLGGTMMGGLSLLVTATTRAHLWLGRGGVRCVSAVAAVRPVPPQRLLLQLRSFNAQLVLSSSITPRHPIEDNKGVSKQRIHGAKLVRAYGPALVATSLLRRQCFVVTETKSCQPSRLLSVHSLRLFSSDPGPEKKSTYLCNQFSTAPSSTIADSVLEPSSLLESSLERAEPTECPAPPTPSPPRWVVLGLARHKVAFESFRSKVLIEVAETREARVLLRRHVRGEVLSPVEMSALKAQLRDVAFGIPLAVLLFVPGGSVAIVVLLKVAKALGFELLPTAFRAGEPKTANMRPAQLTKSESRVKSEA